MPFEFIDQLCPNYNESQISYSTVRNYTKLFYGNQSVFEHFNEIIISIPYF